MGVDLIVVVFWGRGLVSVKVIIRNITFSWDHILQDAKLNLDRKVVWKKHKHKREREKIQKQNRAQMRCLFVWMFPRQIL